MPRQQRIHQRLESGRAAVACAEPWPPPDQRRSERVDRSSPHGRGATPQQVRPFDSPRFAGFAQGLDQGREGAEVGGELVAAVAQDLDGQI